jgi:putative phosphoesterase
MEKAAGANKGIDLVIHLGDYVRDAMKFEEMHENIRHEYVPGNNDWIKETTPDRVLLLEGKRIFVTHGHHYNVKMTFSRLISKGKSENADAVFFGHTHIPHMQYTDGILLLNPGSAGLYNGAEKPTYCLVEIKDGEIKSKFLT